MMSGVPKQALRSWLNKEGDAINAERRMLRMQGELAADDEARLSGRMFQIDQMRGEFLC